MTHLQVISSNSANLYKASQLHTAHEEEYTYHYATEDFMNQLMQSIMQQPTVFAALNRVREINNLNGFKVVSDYDIAKIKIAFKESQNRKNENRNNKRGSLQKGVFKYQKEGTGKRSSEKEYVKEKYKQLQKGYMKMLSNYSV